MLGDVSLGEVALGETPSLPVSLKQFGVTFTGTPTPPDNSFSLAVTNMAARLYDLIPPWFPDPVNSPVLIGMLTGLGYGLAYIQSLYSYAVSQTRIKTAFGPWLDLIAWDFFGGRFTRHNAELDVPFQSRILSELLRPRDTAAAIARALQDVTSYSARVMEPNYPHTAGAWGRFYWGIDNTTTPGRFFGSNITDQFFVETPLPALFFGPNPMPSWGHSFYWNIPPASAWFDPPGSKFGIQVVYDTINATRVAGTTAWVKIVAPQAQWSWDQPGVTWDQSGVTWA